MSKSISGFLFVLIGILFSPGQAAAQYEFSFPIYPDDAFDYDYPQMRESGDSVEGIRSTPDIPSVNYLEFSIGFDGTNLDNCDAQVRFFFDDIFLGYAILAAESDFFYTFAGVLDFRPDQVIETTDHSIKVELITDLSKPACGADYFTIDVDDSYIVLDLINGDVDGDGQYNDLYYGDDCDDDDASVYNGAPELCDGKDNDCDGLIDEGVQNTYFPDEDADTYGDGSGPVQACSAPAGYVTNATDCDDGDGDIYPGAIEICDGIDNDCDGHIDENAETTYYEDSDGDSYGNSDETTQACSAPQGYVGRGADCNDDDEAINPGATEICDGIDNNCNGQIDEGVTDSYYPDNDDDGYGSGSPVQACSAPSGYSDTNGDCDDSDENTHPGAEEICDGLDNNCDGSADEGVTTTYYQDGDDDGYGGTVTTQACSAPNGYAGQGGDCDDADDTVYPGAPELCDGKDNDCDGETDEGALLTFYRDFDGDDFGAGVPRMACNEPRGYTSAPGDCDDTDSTVYPGAPELCDGKDNDCDGEADEGVTNTYYVDDDGDGVGSPGEEIQACASPDGYADDNDDCNDNDASIYPGAAELCDEKDNDCDGIIDEGVQDTVYADTDGDGWGDSDSTLDACEGAEGYVGRPGDCDDSNDAINPNAEEICDGLDNDCDGATDENVLDTWYADGDNDDWGDEDNTTDACSAPAGYVGSPGDCNDADDAINPDANEACNGQDDDCDGGIDEGVESTYYPDSDDDGYGTASGSIEACEAPAGFSDTPGDCDDGRDDINPGATEVCDDADNDCDGQSDEGVSTTYHVDADGDGYGGDQSTQACELPSGHSTVDGDCDDSNSQINPDADEICDEVDNDCDVSIDEGVTHTYYGDDDGDGYGVDSDETQACSAPSGYSDDAGDCDDGNDSVYPGANELCDGLDNDCDASIDEDATDTYYSDEDGDGYGDPDSPKEACEDGNGLVSSSSDCDDNNDAVNPGADEVCNGIDDNCNGETDENVTSTYYLDADGDTFGASGQSEEACSAPNGYVETFGDCDDQDASINPDADEICDAKDNDCDRLIDEGVLITFYADTDADTYGSDDNSTQACSRPNGYVGTGGDCNDDDPDVHPNNEEICDGLDQDCDVLVDEGVTQSIFTDSDGDSYGDPATEVAGCTPEDGEVLVGLDCDDSNDGVYPGATEICSDDIDQNCSGFDLLCSDVDEDGDGFTPTEGDCDDADPTSFPGGEEICDDADNDCNGLVDDRDNDEDGYVDTACGGADCDDDDDTVYTGAEELCDDKDNDCNGIVDDRDVDDDGYIASDCGGDDCNDDDPRSNPGQAEVCDSLDNDCNGEVDDIDVDGDGFYTATCSGDDCNDDDASIYPGAPEDPEDGIDNNCDGNTDEGGDSFDDDDDGWTEDGGDCDDDNGDVNPDAEEVEGDGIDNDCDGEIDEAADPTPTETQTPEDTATPDVTPSETATETGDATGTEGETPTGDDTQTETEGPTETSDVTPSEDETATPGSGTPTLDPEPTNTSPSGEEGCDCGVSPSSGQADNGLRALILLGFLAFFRRRFT